MSPHGMGAQLISELAKAVRSMRRGAAPPHLSGISYTVTLFVV